MTYLFYINTGKKSLFHTFTSDTLYAIYFPLDKEKRKHLILTGKNGSGKTSVLEAIVVYVQNNILKKRDGEMSMSCTSNALLKKLLETEVPRSCKSY